MTDTTPRLGLSMLVAAQAQKHVTVNEDLALIDMLHDCTFLSMAQNTPPATAADGDCYLVPAGATDAWLNAAGQIACCLDGGWRFLNPFKGMRAYNAADSRVYLYNGSAWKACADSSLTLPASGALSSLNLPQQWTATQQFCAGITVGKASLTELNSCASLALNSAVHNYMTLNAPADMQCAIALGDQSNGTDIVLYRPAGLQDFRIYMIRAGDLATFTQEGRVGIGTMAPTEKLSVNGNIAPAADNSFSFGTAALRAKAVYAVTGTVNTSGSAQKCNVRRPDDAEIACAGEIARHICLYQWKDAVAAKGDRDARLHTGFIADNGSVFDAVESVQAICLRHGIDPFRYGFFCRDEGADGMRYGLRYSELMAFVLMAQQAACEKMSVRLDALEAGVRLHG